MSAAVAEQLGVPRFTAFPESQREVFAVTELASDELVRRRAARLIRFAGEVAVEGAVEAAESASDNPTLLDALRSASSSDETARKMVRTNVHTDVFERTVKSGFVLSVDLDIDASGRIYQNGQTNEQIQLNTLRYAADNPKMVPRIEAETRNMFRLENALRTGLLDEYNFIVISRCADDMSDQELEDAGFFTHTKSMAIQVTGLNKAGGVTTESAFVAGVQVDGAARCDAETVQRFGQNLGVHLSGSAAETIDTPLLISKSMMPNGVVDVVRLMDEAAGGTFFGERKPVQDYVRFRAECRQREVEMAPTIDKITDKLIAQASSLTTPQQAAQLLDKLSGEEMVKKSLTDNRIDSRVFGTQAAWYIEDARAHFAAGEMLRVQQVIQMAIKTERSSSCPGGAGKKTSGESGDPSLPEGLSESVDTGDSEELQDCEFTSKQCPKCGEKDVKTVVKNGKYYGACGCVG